MIKKKITIALSSHLPGLHTEEIFSFAKKTGFDGIEYLTTIRNLHAYPKKIFELSTKYTIPIISLHEPSLLVVKTPLLYTSRLLTLAHIWQDVQLVNFHLSGFINTFRVRTDSLKKLVVLAKEKNILLTFESNPQSPPTFGFHPSITRNPKEFADFCLQHKLHMTLDTSHIADNGVDIVEFFSLYASHISLIHLSDYADTKQHLPLGEGNLPIIDLCREIKKRSWTGQITFEIIKFPGIHTKEDKLKKIKNSLDIIRKYT